MEPETPHERRQVEEALLCALAMDGGGRARGCSKTSYGRPPEQPLHPLSTPRPLTPLTPSRRLIPASSPTHPPTAGRYLEPLHLDEPNAPLNRDPTFEALLRCGTCKAVGKVRRLPWEPRAARAARAAHATPRVTPIVTHRTPRTPRAPPRAFGRTPRPSAPRA